ncbi:hypothetical protein ES703_29440 [subsurface metagenome]
MKAPIIQCCLYVHHRVVSQPPILNRLIDPLFYCRDIIFGYGTTYYLFGKLMAATTWQRLQLQENMTVLTMSSGLLFVLILSLSRRSDGLFIWNLGGF